MMQPGQKVRVKSAPDRIGILTNDVQEIGGKKRWLVQFLDGSGSSRLPEGNLELAEENQTLESLIKKGFYGGVSNLRGAITYARLTGRLADIIYSMESTNTNFYAYQFKPVLNFLDSPSNGILIADEVGLGKTIEAGLIWTELRSREDVNRLLVICPAVLREKWEGELLHRFGIRAEICDSQGMLRRLQQENKRHDGFAIIASMQGIRPPKDWEDEKNQSNAALLARFIENEKVERELFDCVIVDEAHYLRNSGTQTNELCRIIRPATRYLVMLSATPVQMKSEDLFNLLNLIDDVSFEDSYAFERVLSANRPILQLASLLRRGYCDRSAFREAVEKCLAHPLLNSNRQLGDILIRLPSDSNMRDVDFRIRLANRIERINLLGSVISRTRKRHVIENRVIRNAVAISVPMTAIELSFYARVTETVREYCEECDLFEGFMLTIPQRQMCSSMPAALRSWIDKAGIPDDDTIVYETSGVNELSGNKLNSKSSKPLSRLLAKIVGDGVEYEALRRNDSKYKRIISLLRSYWKQAPGAKVILFSYFRETLHYLSERLSENGISSQLVMGGMDKVSVVESFRESITTNILLSSEVMSEGVDLQFSSMIINYDLPWNPMRIEQRIGRIDRIGQEQPRILINNFFYENTLDDRVYNRLMDRLGIFQNALGDLESVLGERIVSLTFDLLSHKLTPEQEQEKIEQTANAIAQQRQNQEQLEEEAAGLVAYGDFVLNRVKAAKDMQRFIAGKDLLSYVEDYYQQKRPGCKFVRKSEEPLMLDIELSIDAKAELQWFVDHNRNFGRTQLCQNPLGVPVTCYFTTHVDFGSPKHEVVNQYHPLVRHVTNEIESDKFHPIVAAELSVSRFGSVHSGIYLVVAKRWSTSGARTLERVVYRGIDINTSEWVSDEEAELLVTVCLGHGKDWLDVTTYISAEQIFKHYSLLESRLDQDFIEYSRQMDLENDDKIDLLISNLEAQTKRRIQSREEAIKTLRAKDGFNGSSEKTKRIVSMNQSQIEKNKASAEQRRLELERQRRINTEPRDIILGVIHVK